ncbi:MAG: GSCFA domain-containing protein [Rhodobacteraceae bacterium]|nr:GSCFA domain-containing protein [Paracoccaceae bacterium]
MFRITERGASGVAAGEGSIERVSAEEAMLRANRNALRRYPAPGRDGDRLYPLASPSVTPGFRIAPTDTVFAIGSCFARNVEKALETAGLRVLSRGFDLGEIGDRLDDATNFFNKYSIHSVTNEIRWALDRESFPGEAIFYPLGPDRYLDLQLGVGRLDFPLDTILAFRHRYLDALAAVAHADVVILTLGYVETWFDRALGLYLNVAPPAPLIRDQPGRFEFVVLSYNDVLAGLEAFHDLLLRHRTRPLRMLVTVSPVPLLSTFRGVDVLVANAYSKSVQRAALEEFVKGREGVDYFPSYEFVALSNPTVAWARNDYRHVSQDVINRIMDNVLTNYMGTDSAVPHAGEGAGALSGKAVLSTLRMMLKLERYDDILTEAEANRSLVDHDADALLIESQAARRLDRHDLAHVALTRAVEADPSRPDLLERLIVSCRPLRALAEAEAHTRLHRSRFPDRAEFRARLTWLPAAAR